MSIKTNLKGRLRNTDLPTTHGLMPVFESITNSIHAIEDFGDVEQGKITLRILRSAQEDIQLQGRGKRGPAPSLDIWSFSITDNGIGFNDENMEAFETLDTEHKISRGCRGVGRLLWLKAFEYVEVTSVFEGDSEHKMLRTFRFNDTHGIHSSTTIAAPIDSSRETTVKLVGFDKKYQKNAPKTLPSISNSLFEHCLWYFVRDGSAPDIEVVDGDDSVSLFDIYDAHMESDAVVENLAIKSHSFSITHIKLREMRSKEHGLAFCASNRLVAEEPITNKVAGLFGRISDEHGDFTYSCYISSPYLDKKVRPERTGFSILETPKFQPKLFDNEELSMQEIREKILSQVSVFLNKYLQDNLKKGAERLNGFVSQKAPRYRYIAKKATETGFNVNPDIADKDLELALHKLWAEEEQQLLEDGHELLNLLKEGQKAEYEKRLPRYMERVTEMKMSDLADYVFHRRFIIDMFECAIQIGPDGKYANEDQIHELIMPMRVDSNDVKFDNMNLWLIDERLAFHYYLASDKTINSMPTINSSSALEPDILALNLFDNPHLMGENIGPELAKIIIIEIKKPMRDDAIAGHKKDPIEQSLNYLDEIRTGSVLWKGRPIPNADKIQGFCFILCDLTESVIKRCRIHGLKQTPDGMGYFGHNPEFDAYIEVSSFDRVLKSAKERNRAFFDKLGLPTT
ncbi:MAG: ATP-binding protein [Deltaproteobacteria bacterium]|nr:ATP-binding protein [Deltaproteobacteria bacterium]MCB9490199.1 ATP-binding protein [Deltaproteobacteria bacterium]